MLLLIYTLCAFGFSYGLGSSKLSLLWRTPLATAVTAGAAPGAKPQKFLGGMIAIFFLTLIECPACSGFWIGIACAQTELGTSVINGPRLVVSLVFGFWTVATNLILARLAGISAQEGET